MKVIIKKPNLLPEITTIGDHYTDLQRALSPDDRPRMFERCMSDGRGDDEVSVWCDEEYLLTDEPQVNVRRPNDGHPICGIVIVTGTKYTSSDGAENGDLSDANAALWMYVLTACSPNLIVGEGQMRERPPGPRVSARERILEELREKVPASHRGRTFAIDSMVARLKPLTSDQFDPRFTITSWDD